MYKLTVNDKFTFDIAASGKELELNNAPIEIDASSYKEGNMHILHNNKTYNVELVAVGEDKTAVIKVNGNEYTVAIKDRFDLLLHQLGMDNLTATKVKDVKAPMPGMVLSILVAIGQDVKKGENLVVLEAMKMENILKSPADGKVAKIAIKVGDKLEKNTVLIEFS